MPDELKITFQLTAHEDQRLEVRLTAPGGETKGEADLPPKEVLDELALADPARLSGALIDKVGGALYDTLIGEAVDDLVADTLADALRAGQPAQFELRFDPDQVALASYPWEMIRNAQGQYLVRDGLVDLTRYITYPQPPPAFDESIHDLPLFRVVSQPPSLPQITAIDLKIKPMETLSHATFEGFMRRLLVDRLAMWGLQFDGHGALASQCPKCDALNGPDALICWSCGESLAGARRIGALAFEKEGSVNWVPTGEFGSVLYNAHVRLAMLLACETARVGDKLIFRGLAPGLLLAGVPAVIGMQFPVRDDFANSFANEFYAALARHNDVLSAMRVARRMNMLGAWYSPALYLRRRPGIDEEKPRSAYLTRNIDTAAPTRVQPGIDFLARLWIRRPETKPLSASRLRKELDISKEVPVRQNKGEIEVKFEPVENRQLRRGEVEVQMTSSGCDVKPDERIKLFIDESLDAPPAIFTARAKQTGHVPLIFNVYQDGGQIHSVVHHIEVSEGILRGGVVSHPIDEIATHSQPVAVEGSGDLIIGGKPSATSKPPDTREMLFGPVSSQPHLPRVPLGAARLVADDGQSYPLASGETRIGRSPDNAIYLASDQTVSRWHAVVVRQEDGAVLQDLLSTGGTFVNGERSTTVLLQNGDVIQFGQHTRLRFEIDEVQSEAPLPPDMDDTLHFPGIPQDKVDLSEQPVLSEEEWQEDLQDMKELLDQIEPDREEFSPPAEAPSPLPPPQPPSQADVTVPSARQEVQQRLEEARSQLKQESERQAELERMQHEGTKKQRKQIDHQEPRPVQPPVQMPSSIPGPASTYQPPYGGYVPEPGLSPDQVVGHQKKSSRLPMILGGCLALVVIIGLLVLLVMAISKGYDGPTGKEAHPVIEAVEHSPDEVGYGEFCPEGERQFTVRARVSDPAGLREVALLYTFYSDGGTQVGGGMTIPMTQVEPGLYEATIPTSVTQNIGYNALYGEIRLTITALDDDGNQTSVDDPKGIPIHQCIG